MVAEGRKRIEQLMAEAGRDPAALRHSISIQANFEREPSDKPVADRTVLQGSAADMIDLIRAYEDAGLQHMVISFRNGDPEYNFKNLDRFANEVMGKL